MNDEPHPFQPGVEVALVTRSRYSGVSYTVEKVEKLHKTGRFVLESSTRQFRPYKRGDQWCAGMRSDSWGTSQEVELITDKLKAEVEKTKLEKRFQSAVDRLMRIRNHPSITSRATEKHCEAVERILSDLEGGEK